MVRNVEGLKRSAQVRSDDARERTTAAISLMQSEEVEINFRTVAARAQVSTAWLYKTKTIRATIMKARHTSPAAAGESPRHRQRRSHEMIVATLRLRIKTLEERNHQLTEQIEALYGRVVGAPVRSR